MTLYDVKYTSEYILIFWSQNCEENEVFAVANDCITVLKKILGVAVIFTVERKSIFRIY